MGLIERVFSFVFGGGPGEGSGLARTVEVFRENEEAKAQREANLSHAALAQFAAEFAVPRRGAFDRLMDGLNRIPRPALALGTLGLFVSAMVEPVWFAERMQGISLVPEPLWWLMGAIVSFYFGARHQIKGQEFQRSIASTMMRTPDVTRNIAALRSMNAGAEQDADSPDEDPNPALEEWRRTHDK